LTLLSAVTCTELTPANGGSNCSGDSNPGEICTVTCNTGYRIQSGDATRICMNEGIWSGTEVMCEMGKWCCCFYYYGHVIISIILDRTTMLHSI